MASVHPSATLYSRSMTILQNGPYNHVFALAFLLALLLTGISLRLLLCLLLAFLASCAYQYFLQPLQPPPARSAVLVTGAGGGLGALMAERLAGLGLTVYAGVRKAADGDKLREKAGDNIVPVVFDVTRQAEVDAAYRTIREQLTHHNLRLYALINNAGFGAHSPIELISPDRLRTQFDTNVLSLVAVTQTFLPLLRVGATAASESRIVLLSSVAGHVTVAGSGPYSSTKHAVEAIGNAMRTELSRYHIRTTLIEPGFFPTTFKDTAMAHVDEVLNEAEQDERIKQRVPQSVVDNYRTSMKGRLKPFYQQPPQWVVDSVMHALFRSDPPSRLVCGIEGAAIGLIRVLPDKWIDRVVGAKWQ